MNKLTKGRLFGQATFLIILGILFIIFGKGMVSVLFTVIGALLCAGGIALMFMNPLAGVFCLLIGVLLIVGAWTFVNAILLVFGIITALSGIFGIVKYFKSKSLPDVIQGCCSIVMGGLMIACFWEKNFLFYVVGACWILVGVIGMIFANKISKEEDDDHHEGGKKVKDGVVDVKPIEK